MSKWRRLYPLRHAAAAVAVALRPFRRGRVLLFGGVLLISAAIYANVAVLRCRTATHHAVGTLPTVKACLVLGASRQLANGDQNLFYRYRMDAAQLAYTSGKCRILVVSGDNRQHSYNEPEDMKQSLVSRGVPAAAIVCDYAGGRTLDSVVRFRQIFGQNTGIVISQEFHNARAIYIARHHDLHLVGFNAREVAAYHAFRTQVREVFSRVRAVLDVQVLRARPRHLGPAIAL